jgi:hypothetical protein
MIQPVSDAWAGIDIDDAALNAWVEERAREISLDLVDDGEVVWTGSAWELDNDNGNDPDVRAAIIAAMDNGRADLNLGAGGTWTIAVA